MPIKISIPRLELFDERANEFVTINPTTIVLEHSLVSISKWESKWHKPFLSKKEKKTYDETIDYIRCMTINQNVDPIVYAYIPDSEYDRIREYMEDPMTATWFRERKGSGSREIVTSEIIYYWMVALGIPFECQKWHINRLLTLVRVCNEKNSPGKKMSNRDILAQNAKLNAARRAKLKTKG